MVTERQTRGLLCTKTTVTSSGLRCIIRPFLEHKIDTKDLTMILFNLLRSELNTNKQYGADWDTLEFRPMWPPYGYKSCQR